MASSISTASYTKFLTLMPIGYWLLSHIGPLLSLIFHNWELCQATIAILIVSICSMAVICLLDEFFVL